MGLLTRATTATEKSMPTTLVTVLDDPAYTEAKARATDRQQQLDVTKADLDIAIKDPSRSTREAVDAMRAGVAVPAVVTADDLRQSIAVLTEATRLDGIDADRARAAAFQPICEAAKLGQIAAVRAFISQADALLKSRDDLSQYNEDVLRRGDGSGFAHPFMEIGIDRQVMIRLKSEIDNLRVRLATYSAK